MTNATQTRATAPATLDLSTLTVADTEPVKVTRKRKARELSPLAAHIKSSFTDKKWKAVPAANEEQATQIKRILRADANQMSLGLSVHVDGPDAKGKFVVKFLGRTKRGNGAVVAAATS